MATVAELLAPDSAARLTAARRQAEEHQAQAAATPVQAAVCPACGQRRPAPAAVFREAAR